MLEFILEHSVLCIFIIFLTISLIWMACSIKWAKTDTELWPEPKPEIEDEYPLIEDYKMLPVGTKFRIENGIKLEVISSEGCNFCYGEKPSSDKCRSIQKICFDYRSGKHPIAFKQIK